MASPPRARPTRLPRLRMRDELLKVSVCFFSKVLRLWLIQALRH